MTLGGGKTKANGEKLISFLESAPQSYPKSHIAMSTSEHLKHFVDGVILVLN